MRCWTNGPSRGCLDTAGATKTMMMSLPLLSMSRREIELMLRVMTKADGTQVDQKGKEKIRGKLRSFSTEKERTVGLFTTVEHRED